jgi:hypothetical protein
MELEVFFTIIQQTYSKLVISFMNRKSSCGYATHFLLYWHQFLVSCYLIHLSSLLLLLHFYHKDQMLAYQNI